MAKEKETKDAKPEIKAESKTKSEGSSKLFIIMFAGVMVIQLVIVFVVVFLFLNKGSGDKPKSETKEQTTAVEANKESDSKESKESGLEEGPVISYQTKDIIVNPRGSGGKRFLMTQVGIYISDEKFKREMETERESQINGIINQYLSSKTTEELIDIERRDTLRVELKNQLNKEIPGNKIRNVYFSKFVVQ